jgi:hypothetical protein
LDNKHTQLLVRIIGPHPLVSQMLALLLLVVVGLELDISVLVALVVV